MAIIAFSGNIGVGKTTLSHLISKELNLPVSETDMQNPFLSRFYEDMKRWAFPLQLWFLMNRVQSPNTPPFIQDRTLEEEANIFVNNMYSQGLFSRDEYEIYSWLYKKFRKAPHIQPSVIIFLHTTDLSIIRRNIEIRGRRYELSIEDSYLKSLNNLYYRWIRTAKKRNECPIFEVDISEVNIMDEEYVKALAKSVSLELNGGFTKDDFPSETLDLETSSPPVILPNFHKPIMGLNGSVPDFFNGF